MPQTPSPARLPRRIESRFIAAELARIRARSGRTGEQVGKHMGWSHSKVSRAENGRSPIDVPALSKLLDYLGATASEKGKILAAAADSEARSNPFLGAEAIAEWGPTVLPGASQCPAYAWAVESSRAARSKLPPSAAEEAVDASLRWQKLALDGALQIEVIFDESCLLRQYGGPQVMDNQASYLMWLAERPGVSIRMVPLDAIDAPAAGAFSYIRFPAERGLSAADTVMLHTAHGIIPLGEERETYHYHFELEHLAAAALPEDATVKAIGKAQRQWAARSAA